MSDSAIERCLALMLQLRHPTKGCDWDKAQTLLSLVPHTLEEAYEVAAAIESGQSVDIQDELADLLLQIIFYAQIGSESGDFDFESIACRLADKIESRHPHLFGSPSEQGDGPMTGQRWENIKQKERSDQNKAFFDSIPSQLPALSQAQKIQKRASSVGFDWTNALDVVDKVQEELNELKLALMHQDMDEAKVELGDLLFSMVNVSRHLQLDAEQSLRFANQKFMRRFLGVRQAAEADGKSIEECDVSELEDYWVAVKCAETETA